MSLKPSTTTEVRELSKATKIHFGLFEKEVSVYLTDFTDRVKAAEGGDEIAGQKLLKYLRACLMSQQVPDPIVADWAARCIFEITHHGVDAGKAFSLSPEAGRPRTGPNHLRDLLTWEDVEVIRIENGLSKIDSIAHYQSKRESLLRQLEKSGERGQVEEISTLEKMYRRGARLVKRYLAETGK